VSIAAVVLAAGASTRLGEPKQLVVLGGETLLERAVRVAREAACQPVVVVVGSEYVKVLGNSVMGDVVTVINDNWQEGMGSSIRLGVQALAFATKDAEGVLLMTCDQPAVTARHLVHLTLLRAEVKASRYAGKNGVPAFFPKKYFDNLMDLKGDAGARELLAEARYEELENGELDVDTVEDLKRVRELFG
jgi:CTP:molybdopterin cytidylyltransferase MocA